MKLANGVRGEAVCEVGGAPRRLCLTFGALAQIETALGVEGLGALGARLPTLADSERRAVLAALMAGGREASAEMAEALARATPAEMMRAIAAAVREAVR